MQPITMLHLVQDNSPTLAEAGYHAAGGSTDWEEARKPLSVVGRTVTQQQYRNLQPRQASDQTINNQQQTANKRNILSLSL